MTKTLTKMAATVSVSAGLLPGASAAFAETWDLPRACCAVGAEFAACVTAGTGGGLTLQTHPGGSLFAGGEIKRAVQSVQVNIGEHLLSGHQNENALFGFNSVPFLAT